MNFQKTKIKIDTTKDSEKNVNSSILQKVKKTVALLWFIYLCVPIAINLIKLPLLLLNLIFISNSDSENFSKFLSDIKTRKNDVENKELLEDNKDELCQELKNKVAILESFLCEVKKNGEIDYEESNFNLIKTNLEETDNRTQEEIKKIELDIVKQIEVIKRETYIPANIEVSYNKKEEKWETRKLEGFKLAWENPNFFFIISQINNLSKLVNSLIIYNKEKYYSYYFHTDIIIKSLIINILIRGLLDWLVKNFSDQEEIYLEALINGLALYINFFIFISDDILLQKLPIFWSNISNWLIKTVILFYDLATSSLINFFEDRSLFFENFSTVSTLLEIITNLFWINFFGLEKKRLSLTLFFINFLIPRKVANGQIFSILKAKKLKEENEILLIK